MNNIIESLAREKLEAIKSIANERYSPVFTYNEKTKQLERGLKLRKLEREYEKNFDLISDILNEIEAVNRNVGYAVIFYSKNGEPKYNSHTVVHKSEMKSYLKSDHQMETFDEIEKYEVAEAMGLLPDIEESEDSKKMKQENPPLFLLRDE